LKFAVKIGELDYAAESS